MADRWSNGRQIRRQKILDGNIQFCNLDYPMLFNEFIENNFAFSEREDGCDELKDCARVHCFFSRVAGKGNWVWALVNEYKKLHGGKSAPPYDELKMIVSYSRDFAGNSFQDLLRLVFYGWLSFLQRTGKNWVQEIEKISEIVSIFQPLNTQLQNMESRIDKELASWVETQVTIEKERQQVAKDSLFAFFAEP